VRRDLNVCVCVRVCVAVPIKCMKRTCVARGMFHNAADIAFFKPIELWTKTGRAGHIIESLGTHGRMRCAFDGVVQANDTICLSLYARQYPPWPVSDGELRRDAQQHTRDASAFVSLPHARHAAHAAESVDVALRVGGGLVASGK
jgi:hypothetical protein